MNDIILALDGFKNNETYYGGTESIYIHNDDYEIKKIKRFNWKESLSI